MRTYSNKIALLKNSRGIYILDTSIGCKSGMEYTDGGCYGDCYSAKSAKIYGYDFKQTIFRDFINDNHKKQIINKINKIPLDFVRIGSSGDPSENWEHTIKIIKKIESINKQIIIVTKHWNNLTDEHLKYFANINVCVNTSVSALDSQELLSNSLLQYQKLKLYCKSILRIVSCDFNLNNPKGYEFNKLQEQLFLNDDIIDTVFRPSKNNYLVKDNIINVYQGIFNVSKQLISKKNKKTYTGNCASCLEMCGVKIKVKNQRYPDKKGIVKQIRLFK